jgi:aspartate aminotransferase-like enzyme
MKAPWAITSYIPLPGMEGGFVPHQSRDLPALSANVEEGLQYLFQTKNEVLVFPGRGVGVLEGAVVNFFSPQDKVVVGIMGEGGSEWAQIGERFGLQVLRLGSKRGEVITAEDIELLFRSEAGKDVKGVFITHNEISTGVVADIEKLGKVCREHNVLFLVDALNSLGVADLKTDEWGVDVVAGTSSKALKLPVLDLSFLSVSNKGWKYNNRAHCPRYYFDLAKIREGLPHPFPEDFYYLFYLDRALQAIKKEGLENIFTCYRKLSFMLRRGIETLGLELLVSDEHIASPSVVAIKIEPELEGEKFASFLKEEGIATIGGESKLREKIILIDHSACGSAFDIANIVATLGRALKAQGVVVDLAKSLAQVWEVYDSE